MHWGYGIFGFSPCFVHLYSFLFYFCSFPPHPLFFSFNFSPPWVGVHHPNSRSLELEGEIYESRILNSSGK